MIWLLPWDEDNTARHVHFAVYVLMALNIGVFAAMWYDRDLAKAWFDAYALWPNDPQWYQFITGNFLHADLFHLLGNMLFLWLLGDNIEDIVGHAGFLLIYFVGGLCGDLLFVSGQVGTRIEAGAPVLVAGGLEPETRQTLDNIRAIVEKAGTTMDRVVKCTVMLADMNDWPKVNEIYATYFPGPKPARSAFGATGLALGARVEIECIARIE